MDQGECVKDTMYTRTHNGRKLVLEDLKKKKEPFMPIPAYRGQYKSTMQAEYTEQPHTFNKDSIIQSRERVASILARMKSIK